MEYRLRFHYGRSRDHLLYSISHYYYFRGYHDMGLTPLAQQLADFHVGARILALIFSVVAAFREKPPTFAPLAFLLALFSFLFYVG